MLYRRSTTDQECQGRIAIPGLSGECKPLRDFVERRPRTPLYDQAARFCEHVPCNDFSLQVKQSSTVVGRIRKNDIEARTAVNQATYIAGKVQDSNISACFQIEGL